MQKTSSLRVVPSTPRPAVGVIRVSEVAGRKGERFVSPTEQRRTIEHACEREGLELVNVYEELDVSGGKALARRPGLTSAIEEVERGDAEVLVVAYFDRLVRNLGVQQQILERVEAAEGSVLAVDVGHIRTDTAAHWLTSVMLGMVAEYHRRITGEKTREAKLNAIERGVPPFAHIPPGYRRGDDGRLVVEPAEAEHVAEAFRRRAAGASISEVRAYLAAHKIERTYRSTQTLLRSPTVLGELHCDGVVNINSHKGIVDRETWQRAQRTKVRPGRRTKSPRLLARLGILRCSACDAPLTAGSMRKSTGAAPYPVYRCSNSHKSDCAQPVIISAERAERAVVEYVRTMLAGVEESASVESNVAAAEAVLARAQAELDAAVFAFSGLDDVASARERLLELRQVVHAADDQLARLRSAATPAALARGGDWEALSLDGQRALIPAVIRRAIVWPGRASKRITFEPLS